jgi:hypothetical protein
MTFPGCLHHGGGMVPDMAALYALPGTGLFPVPHQSQAVVFVRVWLFAGVHEPGVTATHVFGQMGAYRVGWLLAHAGGGTNEQNAAHHHL